MNMNAVLKIVMLGLLTLLFAGCVTRIDWDARVGHYTYDQAITEFGPPDKMARLTNGKLVADWISHYTTSGAVFVGPGYYPGGIYDVATAPSVTYTDTLRLTFTTNNVLCAWVKK